MPRSWHSHCIRCKVYSHSSKDILRKIPGDLYAHLSLRSNALEQDLANSTKGLTVNILGFAGHTFSVATTQLCHSTWEQPQRTHNQMGVAGF